MSVKLEHLSELKEKLTIIKNRGYIDATRGGNTGIGKTLEDNLNKMEDNLPKADFYNIEIKGKRKNSKSFLSLFTKAPTFPEQANYLLKEKYGIRNDENSEKRLNTTIKATRFNSFKKKYGFKLEVDRKARKINIFIKDLKTNILLEKNIGYSFESLEQICEEKIKYLTLAYAETKRDPFTFKEKFYYENFYFYSDINFERFINLIELGKIKVDIRIGENPDGSSHDHGTAFRIKPEDMKLMYKNYKNLNI
jgi:hypothetical protein